jgi:tetratricopeptide (TPR) repeat protein
VSPRRRTAAGDAAPPRRAALVALLALGAVFALKLAVLLQLHDHPLLRPEAGLDTVAYVELAREVLRGNLALGPALYVVPPLYPYFLALVLWLAGSLFWVRIAQVALGTAAVALIFRTAEMWFGRRAAWLAGGLAACAGILTFHEVLLLPAALDPFLTALVLYLLAAALREPDNRRVPALRAGVAFGALALNRPNALLAAAALAVLLLIARRARTALLLTAGLLAALAPVIARNYAVAADISPLSSHGGLSFYVGNNPQADGTPRAVDGITPFIVGQREDARRVAEKAIGRALDDSEVSAHFYGLAWKWIREEPGRAARSFVRKLAYVFNAAHPSLNYSYPYYVRDERNLLRFLPVGPWLLVPLGLVGVWLCRPTDPRQRRAFWLWASFLPLYAVSVAAFFVSSRHRLPLLAPLCVTAGAALDALAFRRGADREARSSRARWVAIAAVLAAVAIFANWRFALEEGRTEERTRMALWLIGQERYDEAEARVTAIERDHPQPGALRFRVGRALLARRQADAAVRHLERARAIDPGRPEIDFALGQALLDARRPKDAIPHLRRALEAGVRQDLAGLDLARAHAAAGDRVSALRVLQGIRPARPDDGNSWRALGELALELQAPRLAEPFLRQSVTVAPDSGEAHEQLGLAIALGGRYEEAIGSFREAVRINQRDASAHLNLAVAYAETGRVADARQHAREALRLEPAYERARQLLEALEQPR